MKIRLLMMGVMAALACCAEAQTLTPEHNDIECGQQLFRSPATFTVSLRNNSGTATRITNVDTGCGCTVASFPRGDIAAGQTAAINITLDGKMLGHFERVIRVYDSNSPQPAEISLHGLVVEKVENYSGDYPFKFGDLLTDVDNIEFDDIRKGQRSVQEIHIMNPTSQNVQPTVLRLPPYLTAEMRPEVLGPKQNGTMYIALKSQELRDYGLTQTTVYLGKNPADKVSADKEMTVSAVLLPKAMSKTDLSRPYAPKLEISSYEIDMTELSKKSKAKGEITLTNSGKSTLEIQKLQLFTAGLQVQLDKQSIEPGQTARLKVTGIAKELKKVRTRPRILMITNDPDRAKVVIGIKK